MLRCGFVLVRYLNVSDERHGDSFFKLVQRGVQVQDFHNLQRTQQQQRRSLSACSRGDFLLTVCCDRLIRLTCCVVRLLQSEQMASAS